MPLGDILISEAEIANAIPRLASRISEDYSDKDPLFVGVIGTTSYVRLRAIGGPLELGHPEEPGRWFYRLWGGG